jgi:dihydroorotate dehydrogenase
MSCKPRQLNKFLSFLGISLGGTMTFGAILAYRGDETFYSKALMPVVARYVDPELAHEACIFLTKHKLIRCQNKLTPIQEQMLQTNVFNMTFRNPIGIAAGFDKNSQAVFGLNFYGIGFTEVGTVTPRPQDGNPKKRIFRIPQDGALINRCGFNNMGIDFVSKTLSRVDSFKPMLVGLNLGKNKDTLDISSDYLVGLRKTKDLKSIDYYVINISSPNTPGLRDSQEKKNLEILLDDVLKEMQKLSIVKPLLVKVAPDLSDAQIKDIADVVTRKRCGDAKVSGIILTNTTTSRPAKDENSRDYSVYDEPGGLSGRPLRDLSTEVISKFYKLTQGKVPIIGVGGVLTGQDAYDKIKAGATLVQLYTGLTYEGPPVVEKIKRELVELLELDNLTSVEEAVGLNHRVVRENSR